MNPRPQHRRFRLPGQARLNLWPTLAGLVALTALGGTTAVVAESGDGAGPERPVAAAPQEGTGTEAGPQGLDRPIERTLSAHDMAAAQRPPQTAPDVSSSSPASAAPPAASASPSSASPSSASPSSAPVATSPPQQAAKASRAPGQQAPAPSRQPTAPAPAPSRQPTAPAPAPPTVDELTALRQVDLLVVGDGPLSGEQVRRVSEVSNVEAMTTLDVGTVELPGGPGRALGVDPSSFRAFTPEPTAASDPLWQSVARGELVTSYDRVAALGPQLGRSVEVKDLSLRLGGIAAFGLPKVAAVVDHDRARQLGLEQGAGLLVSAPARESRALQASVQEALGDGVDVQLLRPVERLEIPTGPISELGIPRSYERLYREAAASCSGLDWQVLAAVGAVETGHGTNRNVSTAGAMGPMQFLPSTWEGYGRDGDGDGDADITDPADAIWAAAGYLCSFGAGQGDQGLYNAVFAYNHADWYVRKVLGVAEYYRLQD